MNKHLVRFARVVAILLLMFCIGLGVMALMLPQSVPPRDISIKADTAMLERGDYLFNAVLGCPVCHSERNWDLIGAPPVPPIGGGRPCYSSADKPPGMAGFDGFPGTVCFRNITPHPTGVGQWSDGELMRAIREGINKDGKTLFPTMPYFIYADLADEDVKAVIAYLRTLPAVDRDLPATELNFPVGIFISLLPKPVIGEVSLPDMNDSVGYGEYLAGVARCHFCHTPQNDRSRLPQEGRAFEGGNAFRGLEGVYYSTNLTPHESGLGAMTRDDFIALFRSKSGPRTGEIDIMPWTYFANMTDADLGAIYDYLQTLPPRESGAQEET
jgi:mono/diheme cytochrome c family protein